jgi:hypothetical protein
MIRTLPFQWHSTEGHFVRVGRKRMKKLTTSQNSLLPFQSQRNGREVCESKMNGGRGRKEEGGRRERAIKSHGEGKKRKRVQAINNLTE